MVKLCDACGLRPAAVYQPHTKRALCLECFVEDVVSRVRQEVMRWSMVEPGDTVLLALSGGKDGYVLLESMARIHKAGKLVGLNIIEGIKGYNKEEDAKYLVDTAKEIGVDVIVTSVREYTGLSVDDIVAEARRRGTGISACTYCGLARRRIMNKFARELGATKLATAHNLDDESQTAVINLLRGDYVSLLRQHPAARVVDDPLLIRRVKPLRKIYEWETASFARLKGYHLQETECPYIYEQPTLRARVRRALYSFEAENPGSLLKFVEALDEILLSAALSTRPLTGLERCKVCGEPVPPGRELCKMCELLKSIGVKRPAYAIPHRVVGLGMSLGGVPGRG
ncbi:MAG: TIGR00269 family protein [Acidilobus sp.]